MIAANCGRKRSTRAQKPMLLRKLALQFLHPICGWRRTVCASSARSARNMRGRESQNSVARRGAEGKPSAHSVPSTFQNPPRAAKMARQWRKWRDNASRTRHSFACQLHSRGEAQWQRQYNILITLKPMEAIQLDAISAEMMIFQRSRRIRPRANSRVKELHQDHI